MLTPDMQGENQNKCRPSAEAGFSVCASELVRWLCREKLCFPWIIICVICWACVSSKPRVRGLMLNSAFTSNLLMNVSGNLSCPCNKRA